MIELGQFQLTPLLTSGVTIAVVAFIFRIAGRIYTDSKPFRDDSDRTEEAVGPIFVIGVLSGPLFLSAYWLGIIRFFSWDNLYLAFATLVQVLLFLIVALYVEERGRRKDSGFDWYRRRKGIADERWFAYLRLFEPVVGIVVLPCSMLVSTFLFLVELRRGNLVWIAFFASEYFLSFMTLLVIKSLLKRRPEPVNIHFRDGSAPMLGATLMRVNSSDLRLIHGGAVHILNRDMVAKIEVPLDLKTRLDDIDVEKAHASLCKELFPNFRTSGHMIGGPKASEKASGEDRSASERNQE